ncbi:MAG: T9SS type A sorting domain-containing protein, partial [Bacteroidetes bacterium]|nr:T9SS type A sorting domain-containing protein [Bacteroidota bacterium]
DSLLLTSSGSYHLLVSNSNCSATSDTVNVIQLPALLANFSLVGDDEFCDGDEAILVSDTVDGNQWYKNGSAINGETNDSLTVTTSGAYSLLVDNGNCEDLSDSLLIQVHPNPLSPIITQNGIQLTSSYSSGNQWYQDSTIINGETNDTYDVSSTGTYYVSYTDSNGCTAFSNSLFVQVSGIGSIGMEDIIVYPNPANGSVLIRTDVDRPLRLEAYNILGLKIASWRIQNGFYRMDIKSWNEGVYILQFYQGDIRVGVLRLVTVQ